MDCEKFEDTMLDELYGELDELTLAASKRHVGGCARCSTLMAGLKATRKLVTLPVLAPSEGFEGRLLSAVHAAEAKAKPKLGFAQLISIAGQWAMRPQTAMAAVLLLIVGTSSSQFLARRSPQQAVSGASASFTVTERGAPSQAFGGGGPPAGAPEALDPRAAAAAHGLAPLASAAPASPAPMATSAMGKESGDGDEEKKMYAPKSARSSPRGFGGQNDSIGNSVTPGAYGGTGGGGAADRSMPPSPPAAAPGPALKDDSNSNNSQLSQGRANGERLDGVAGGEAAAGLMAARQLRDSSGCPAAVAKFDQVALVAWGTINGYEATLDGAACYARLGLADAARSRYQRLLTVPAYASRAQSALQGLSGQMVASRKAAAKPTAIATDLAARPPAAAAPAVPVAPASPPSATEK